MKDEDFNVKAIVYKNSKNSDNRSSGSFSFNSSNNHRFVMFDNNNQQGVEIDKSSSISNNISQHNSEFQSDTTKYNVAEDPYNELSKTKDVIIKVEYQNCCCVNITNNLYSVFTKKNRQINYLFRAKELMACTDYTCCQYLQKPFLLNIGHVAGIGNEIITTDYATLEKNGIISCFCFCRPEIEVKMAENNNLVGTIIQPFSLGDTTYKIYSKEKAIKYLIDAEYCQSGILFPKNCCGCMPEVFFDIYNDKNEKDGTIARMPGDFKEFMNVLDCYQILFPKMSSVEDKLLIICTVFMIEYEIFRNKWGNLGCCDCEGSNNCCAYCGNCCSDFCSNCFRL